jgi:hypothetical protein
VSVQLHAPAALPRGKSYRYPLDRRLGGPQSRSGRCGEEKILHPTGTRIPTPLVVQPVASRYTDYAIPAHRCCSYSSNISASLCTILVRQTTSYAHYAVNFSHFHVSYFSLHYITSSNNNIHKRISSFFLSGVQNNIGKM